MNKTSLIGGIRRSFAALCRRRMVSRTATREEPALRCDVLNAEHMAAHARRLAFRHRLNSGSSSNRLLQRLDDNEAVLRACIHMFAEAAAQADRKSVV